MFERSTSTGYYNVVKEANMEEREGEREERKTERVTQRKRGKGDKYL